MYGIHLHTCPLQTYIKSIIIKINSIYLNLYVCVYACMYACTYACMYERKSITHKFHINL
jgi:hypothetical protein